MNSLPMWVCGRKKWMAAGIGPISTFVSGASLLQVSVVQQPAVLALKSIVILYLRESVLLLKKLLKKEALIF